MVEESNRLAPQSGWARSGWRRARGGAVSQLGAALQRARAGRPARAHARLHVVRGHHVEGSRGRSRVRPPVQRLPSLDFPIGKPRYALGTSTVAHAIRRDAGPNAAGA